MKWTAKLWDCQQASNYLFLLQMFLEEYIRDTDYHSSKKKKKSERLKILLIMWKTCWQFEFYSLQNKVLWWKTFNSHQWTPGTHTDKEVRPFCFQKQMLWGPWSPITCETRSRCQAKEKGSLQLRQKQLCFLLWGSKFVILQRLCQRWGITQFLSALC